MPRISVFHRMFPPRPAASGMRAFVGPGITTSLTVHTLAIAWLILLGIVDVGQIFDPVVPYPPRRDVASIYVPPSQRRSDTDRANVLEIEIQTGPVDKLKHQTLQAVDTALDRPRDEVGRLPTSDRGTAETDELTSAGAVETGPIRATPPDSLQDGREPQPLQASGAMSRASAGIDALITPRVLLNPAPHYPREALLRRIEGTVTLRVGVAANGAVVELKLVKSSGSQALDAAAKNAVRRWHFLPAIDPEADVRFVNVPINFVIRQP